MNSCVLTRGVTASRADIRLFSRSHKTARSALPTCSLLCSLCSCKSSHADVLKRDIGQPPHVLACSTALGAQAAQAAHQPYITHVLPHQWLAAGLVALTLTQGSAASALEWPAREESATSAAERMRSCAESNNNPLADVSNLFGLREDVESDPVEPFSLYGNTSKKYFIEQRKGEKVLSRRRGITVNTCVAGLAASVQGADRRGLTPTQKSGIPEDVLCHQAEDAELEPACASSCTTGCTSALERYTASSEAWTGFRIEDADKRRVLRNCISECSYVCAMPGKQYDFVIPFRPAQ